MTDTQMTERDRLELRWVPVTDERGRTHMESVWIQVPAGAPTEAAVPAPTTVHAA